MMVMPKPNEDRSSYATSKGDPPISKNAEQQHKNEHKNKQKNIKAKNNA
jgi:hypothetical protein